MNRISIGRIALVAIALFATSGCAAVVGIAAAITCDTVTAGQLPDECAELGVMFMAE